MGENILGAFGYVRRRQTAIEEITRALEDLGLVTDPAITAELPLRVPRIRFFLRPEAGSPQPPESASPSNTETSEYEEEDEAPAGLETLVPAFRIAELDAAEQEVECIVPDATIAQANTRMVLTKFSQLVVASSSKPREQDIKGIVSYQSIAKAMLNGSPYAVRDCTDDSVPKVRSDRDLQDVVALLGVHNVVLVMGSDHRLQGIVTAWDLAEEFAHHVDPFKRIGEIETRLRTLLTQGLGKERIAEFLAKHPPPAASDPQELDDADALTMGDLQRIIEQEIFWQELSLKSVDRATFVVGLERIRLYRNRLMHFRDPLTTEENQALTNFCDLVRQIQP